ncbi:hypothetical protein GJR96_05160 [Haloferax sp. MBLA0076]|uniref:DUF8130 domain-containing protein n=1 Tax=Haloferax litoreum TaxID=2666140 RepID=A0A6A8GI10_9EURY|nr:MULTISPECIES: hypothetical protein [Haloferax]KAB1192866.1 hypothetical protein Hfx1148_05160 [Haloferax sp. CBA1148]MRX21350.1 hypothetical protein [Haloferax litoreum]
MDRRTALQTLAGVSALLGGCLSTPESAPSETPPNSQPPATDNETLSIVSVETPTHALRLNELGASPNSVSAWLHLSDRERDVLEQAIDGGYETADPPEWIVSFVSSTPYFFRDEEYYRLDNPFPRYTITGEIVTEESVSGRIASGETYREAVTHDGVISTGIARLALEEGGYETRSVWDGLREFIETYEAFENPYGEDLVKLTLEHNDAEPPYTITATPVQPTEVTDFEIWDATNATSEIRSVVTAAGKVDGLYQIDTPPVELVDQLESHQYVYLENTFYTTYVETPGALPVSVGASLTDDTLSDGARIELTLTNHDDEEVEIGSGAPRPFGILRFHPRGESDRRVLLWTDAYEESSHVETDGHSIGRIEEIMELTRLKSGETVRHEFRIEETDLQPGRYVIESDVQVSTADGEGGALPYRIVFSVPE